MAQKLQAELTCPICLDFFSGPISLSCAHIFCFDCIQNWMLETHDLKVMCPLCRVMVEAPSLEEWQVRAIALFTKQHDSIFKKTLHMRKELQHYWEDVTLDAATASSHLVFSNDLRSAQCRTIHHDLTKDWRLLTCVLGTPCFSSGQHYWEVKVGEVKSWSLGICKELADRKSSDLSPERGFWIISKEAGAIRTNTNLKKIPASPGLCCVGIFLDVDLEEIQFFDVENNAHVYTHNSVSSLKPLRPFFCLELLRGENGTVLTICPLRKSVLPRSLLRGEPA
ncbi:ret finger protein-like 4B [Callithrix jacchus]|uniref:ret finger protein-like 4B n=1 Tax=Callithrix jacchus TaxID=9483 RepID=UPI0023DD2602|nr:ret finger protein-like 4B [Callithrix jacchus]